MLGDKTVRYQGKNTNLDALKEYIISYLQADGFKIQSQVEIATLKEEEFKKTNPQLATQLFYRGGKFKPDGLPENPLPAQLAKNLPSDLPLLAAWTGVSRVLLNLDDFLTRE